MLSSTDYIPFNRIEEIKYVYDDPGIVFDHKLIRSNAPINVKPH